MYATAVRARAVNILCKKRKDIDSTDEQSDDCRCYNTKGVA